MESYYIWLIIGLTLLILEVATGTFYLLGFGSAAIITAGLNYAFNLNLTYSLFLFAILSPILIKLYILTIRDKMKNNNVGQSSDVSVGRVGTIISEKTLETLAEIQFEVAVMGSRKWFVISKDELKVGDTAKIKSVDGNNLVVEKV